MERERRKTNFSCEVIAAVNTLEGIVRATLNIKRTIIALAEEISSRESVAPYKKSSD
jgi:hypothetical protein